MLKRDQHVTVDCHQNHRQHRNADVAVEDERKHLTQEVTKSPRLVPETNRLHRHHNCAKQKIGEGERQQEGGCCVFP